MTNDDDRFERSDAPHVRVQWGASERDELDQSNAVRVHVVGTMVTVSGDVDLSALPTAADLAAELEAMREGRSLTRRDLANLANLTAETVSAIERGKRVPQTDTVERWVISCGMDPDEVERWIDRYRLATADGAKDIAAGQRKQLAAAQATMRGKDFIVAKVLGDIVTPWHPEHGDAFRAAIDAAENQREQRLRDDIDRMAARYERRINAALERANARAAEDDR